jgi:DNA-binding MarR family transcriptional regulator
MVSEKAELFRLFVRAVLQTQGALLKHGDVMNAPYGQTSATWRVLLYISTGHTTVADIARATGYSRQAVQRLANGLVTEGLACYKKHPTDDRKQCIEMTQAG